MATIGHIRSVSVKDGAILVNIETGSGPVVTAKIVNQSGIECHPIQGDPVIFDWAGQEVIILAALHGDSLTETGEVMIFSRDGDNNVLASVKADKDGAITASNANGQFTLKKNGQFDVNGHLTVEP